MEGEMENTLIYRLGLMLNKDCPTNDCRVFLKIFHEAQEIDFVADSLEGISKAVLIQQLQEWFRGLKQMYYFNYAVKLYREEAQI